MRAKRKVVSRNNINRRFNSLTFNKFLNQLLNKKSNFFLLMLRIKQLL